MIRNANFTGSEVLQIAESEAKLLADTWTSVLPGEAIQPDLKAGNEVWARSSANLEPPFAAGADIRVEITEVN